MASSTKREVDSVTASMTTEELNNLIVSFRKPVKYARTAVAKTLAKKVKLYKKKKKSSEKQETEDKKRAEALQRQIDFLGTTKVDRITKFCLGLKMSFEEVAKKGKPGDIALSRVANQKLIKKKVAEWREKHTDWELLCAFINTQISRRHKNRTSAIIKNERILREREKIAEEEKKNKADGNDESKMESESDLMKALSKRTAVTSKVTSKKSKTDSSGTKKNKSLHSGTKEKESLHSGTEKEETLHPSWAAKKKEKERMFINVQCKRIEFDD